MGLSRRTKVGFTGHQAREGIDWEWVEEAIEARVRSIPGSVDGYCSLAEGADQLFARVLLDTGAQLAVVVPTADYFDKMRADAREQALELLGRATHITRLEPKHTDEDSYLAAGQFIVECSDTLIAVWDGEPAEGLGGTADIVAYAQERGVPVFHIDPVGETTKTLWQSAMPPKIP